MREFISLVLCFLLLLLVIVFGVTIHMNHEAAYNGIKQCKEANQELRNQLEEYREKFSMTLTVTAYSLSKDQCNDDLEHTATMVKPKPGLHVAVSHDLMWMLGKYVYVENMGIRKVADLMNKRYEKRIDIMMPSKQEAKEFGKKKLEVVVLEDYDEDS